MSNQVNTLLKKYGALPLLEKRICQMKALVFRGGNKSDFFICVSRSDLRTTENKRFSAAALNLILDQLIQYKLLLPDFTCNPLIIHAIAAMAIAKDNVYALSNLSSVQDVYSTNYSLMRYNEEHINVRAVHLAVHQNDVNFFLVNKLHDYANNFNLHASLVTVFYNYALDFAWVKTRHPIIQAMLYCVKLQRFFGLCSLLPPDELAWVTFFSESNFDEALIDFPYLQSKDMQLNISMGLLSKARQKALGGQAFYHHEALGFLAFMEGDFLNAEKYFESALKVFARTNKRAEWFRDNLNAIFYVIVLINQNNILKATTAIATLKKISSQPAFADILQSLCYLQQNDRMKANESLYQAYTAMNHVSEKMNCMIGIFNLVHFLIHQDVKATSVASIRKTFESNIQIKNILTAHLYAEFLIKMDETDTKAKAFLSNSPFLDFRFFNLFSVKQPWEYAIDQLQNVMLNKPKQNTPDVTRQDKRLVWFVNPDKIAIHIAEQKLRKNGTWTEGKAIALKRLYKSDSTLTYLTEHDKRVIRLGLRCEIYGWYNEEHYHWDSRGTLNALIGHPLIVHAENPNVPLELIEGEMEVQIDNVEQGYRLSLHYHNNEPCAFLEKETPNRYRVIDFSQDAVVMSNIISKQGMVVPHTGKAKVIEIIQNAKLGIRIHSEIEEDNIPTVEGDATCWMHLLPIPEGLKMHLWVRPFGLQGPYCRVAHGQNKIISLVQANDKESKQKALRDFEKEKQQAAALINNCPMLQEFDSQTDEWHFDTTEACLQAVLELEEYKKNNPLHLEWPQGQPLTVKRSISAKNLSLSIKGSDYWFEYDGEVTLDNGQVLNIKNLLELLSQDSGKFIRIGEGEFVALTTHFKKQLEDLKALSENNKVYHLSSGILRELSDEAQTECDETWKRHIKKVKSMEKHCPVVPSTLQANLREYQEIGFAYLSKLANWEIGACLADDMGLGKTLQTITLLLEQANKGPCLVVAPTSVCFIWQDELSKFAPTLNAHILNHSNERQELIDGMKKMDVLICSYNLLHQEGHDLSQKNWQVAVLDEAQAIKNSDSKRWKAATQLQAKCRIALTGTPIENHLGELWSIFRFLNPGLLGSLKNFQNRFLIPIEKNGDPIAKRALKNLLSPFLLRRTKSEVLQELPAKTEQTIIIEPTTEEMAFYEAIRHKALEKIHEISKDPNASNKRFSILAEITRLRQACCHSSLVDENLDVESSKIKTFVEVVKDIIENKHKALVFSQYVRYLKKIKEVLDLEKISYQYLDGSTPAKKRQALVNDFQAGQGELFLISLKAGGTGLNLTAADYVIILDPWWNPAVEDQAADRAHRMGQKRPVNVYRLIMKNTIEEKIINLHKSKRDLASDLLSGSDMSGTISEEELIKLIS